MARPVARWDQPGLPDQLIVDPAEVVATTVARLVAAGAPTETRVDVVRAAFGRTKLRRAGPVWRLGALCLSADGVVLATGDVLVVTEPTHPNHRSALAVERNELRARALRAGVKVGETVVLDARALDLSAPEQPLVPIDGGIGVIWTTGGTPIPLAAYLAERADLVIRATPVDGVVRARPSGG